MNFSVAITIRFVRLKYGYGDCGIHFYCIKAR